MATVDLIILDCDGVLVDSEVIAAQRTADALRRAGYRIDPPGVIERFLGQSGPSLVTVVEDELGRPLPDTFLEEMRADILSAFETELRPVSGVADALDRLAQPRCVASSSNPRRIRRSLEICGLLARLEPHIFSATMVANGKPAPDLFLHAAAQMHVPAEACLVIEDSLAGVHAAAAAGMRVLGFTGGSHIVDERHGERLRAAGATALFNDMANLPALTQA